MGSSHWTFPLCPWADCPTTVGRQLSFLACFFPCRSQVGLLGVADARDRDYLYLARDCWDRREEEIAVDRVAVGRSVVWEVEEVEVGKREVGEVEELEVDKQGVEVHKWEADATVDDSADESAGKWVLAVSAWLRPCNPHCRDSRTRLVSETRLDHYCRNYQFSLMDIIVKTKILNFMKLI